MPDEAQREIGELNEYLGMLENENIDHKESQAT